MNFLYLKMLKEDTNIFDGAMRMEWFSRRPDIKSEHFKLVPAPDHCVVPNLKLRHSSRARIRAGQVRKCVKFIFPGTGSTRQYFWSFTPNFARQRKTWSNSNRGGGGTPAPRDHWAQLSLPWQRSISTGDDLTCGTCYRHVPSTVPGKQPWSDAGIES